MRGVPVQPDWACASKTSTRAAAVVDAAVGALLQARRIVIKREKAGADVEVDIRPHILDLGLDPNTTESAAGDRFDLLMRLRLGGEGGVGRPDEVVAALAERLARPLKTVGVTRERVILGDGPA